MSRTIERALAGLRERLADMSERARRILAKALRAVRERDAALADEVARDDLEIDRLDVEMDGAVLAVLATQGPLADDLREVVAIKNMALDLERVGDLARNIAKAAGRLAAAPAIATPPELEHLAGDTVKLLDAALACVAARDAEAARAVLRGDDRIDRGEDTVILCAIEAAQRRPESSAQQIDFIFIARNLERVADHATNLAEDVLLVEEAQNVKHSEKLGRPDGP
jgi:phosphate transport system protein